MSDAHKRVVEQVNESFAKGDTEGFLKLCTDDVVWRMVGAETVSGKETIREWMGSMQGEPPTFTVERLIADGDTALATGAMTMKGPSGSLDSYEYCDMYTFRGGLISELKVFAIKTSTPEAKAD